MSIWQTSKQLASLWAETKLTQLELRGKPQTRSDSGGSIDSYSFDGQEIDQSDLRKVKEIRESGGVVAQLVHAKALMKFGTGAQLQSDDDALEEWLADAFGRRLDDVILDLGEDALWYPYGLGEVVALPAGDGFSHVELIEPWTMLPDQDDFGDITRWVQEVDNSKRSFPTDEIGSVVLNKRSGRDKVGLSEVLRSEDEITQFKENQQAINKAIEIAGFPHHVWTVGAEGKSPVSDNDLRRVRNLIDDMDGDTQFVVGPDVDHDKITPGEFDFGAITERDLRMLTASLGLPFELVGYGSDGLGSGHEADLKMNLLAIQNEADRRRFADQFVEQFVEPVVERFSPHSADAEITLQIDPFLDDKQDMAEWIGQVGSYMRNQDVVEKLDLPPIEDDDLASAYRPPQQIEEAEEEPESQGDPFGGVLEESTQSAVSNELDSRGLTSEPGENPHLPDGYGQRLEADGGSGNADRAADYLAAAPEFDRPLLEAYIHGVWDDSATETRVLAFSESELPEMVVANIREAIMGGAIFNDFAEIPNSDLMQLRHFMSEQLESDGWTIDGLADQLQDLEPSLDKPEAERIARTETASVVNNARESGYEERDLEDAQFKWVGPSDGRTTEACEELKEVTNPKYGGDPVELDELKRLVREMQQQHFPSMDPRDWTIHVNERHTYVRHIEPD